MMFGPVRAIIIDDMPSHLFAIGAGITSAGIPCTSYWYDREEIAIGDKLKPAPPVGGHEYLRIIFTDLNLEEHPVSHGVSEAIGPAINVISQLVSKEGGPYVIVFWTGTSFTIEEIRVELIERLSVLDVPLPIAVDELNKGPYISAPSQNLSGEEVFVDLYRTTYQTTSGLNSAIQSILNEYGLLLMLSEWESRAIHAAGRTTNNLFDAAKLGMSSGEDLMAALRKVSALVAKEAAGSSSARENPAKAYDAALKDMLIDSFNQSAGEGGYPQIVENELEGVISRSISFSNAETVYSHLNAMFHIDTNVEGVGAATRGAVLGLTEANKNGITLDVNSFCCWEDYFWEPRERNVSVDSPAITREVETAVNKKLDCRDRNVIVAIRSAFLKAKQERNQKIRAAYLKVKSERQKFAESLRWVLIEVGADCDHAQNKSRTLRYLVGVEVHLEHIHDYVLGGVNNKLKNDALKLLGPYADGDDMFYILISFKRFVTWQPPSGLPDMDVLYRLRKNIVDYLLNKYATWSMRPGIVEYQ